MRNITIILSLLFTLILSGCKKNETPTPTPTDKGLLSFAFLKQDNPSLSYNIHPVILGNQLIGKLPINTDIKNLIATFEYEGLSIKVNDKPQQSGTSIVDFTQIVKYRITNSDGTVDDYYVDAILFTGLPIVNIFTNNSVEIESKEEYVFGEAIMIGGRLADDGSGSMGIRGRGHSTWWLHPKKPYQLRFDEKTEMLGMPKDKKWILLSEHSDKTLIRNRLAFEMGYISNLDWTPECVYAEVFVNDDYRGTYNITQKVEEGNSRVDIGNEGFLLEIDVPEHLNPDDVYFNSSNFTIQIKEPEIEIGSAEFNYIKDYILEFESVLFSNNFIDPVNGYKKYVDVDSFVDWYIINEIAKNQDAKDYSSIYLNLIPGEKLKMGPIWDFDLGFGNVNYSECEFPTEFWVRYHSWINRMFGDPTFVTKVKERFAFFKSNEEYILEIIDSNASLLKYAQAENDKRWDVYGNWIWPNPVVFNSYVEEVNYLKDWFTTRMKWLDETFQAM